VRLQAHEIRPATFRFEVDASVQPAHGHHGQVERRYGCANSQVRVGGQELDVALIPRNFSFTLYTMNVNGASLQ